MWDAKLALLRGGGGMSSMLSPYLDKEDEEHFFGTLQDSVVIDEEDPIQKEKCCFLALVFVMYLHR
jgi:hypothetical protein